MIVGYSQGCLTTIHYTVNTGSNRIPDSTPIHGLTNPSKQEDQVFPAQDFPQLISWTSPFSHRAPASHSYLSHTKPTSLDWSILVSLIIGLLCHWSLMEQWTCSRDNTKAYGMPSELSVVQN